MPGGRTPATIIMGIVVSLAMIGFIVDGVETNLIVSPVVAVTDRVGGFTALDRAQDVAIVEISGRTYMVVTIAATGDFVFEDGNNRQTIQVTVVG